MYGDVYFSANSHASKYYRLNHSPDIDLTTSRTHDCLIVSPTFYWYATKTAYAFIFFCYCVLMRS